MPAPQLSNYVLETATAPGTGSFTLNGPEADRRSFSAAFPNGGSVFYFADDGAGAEWGIGTLTVGTPSVLARTTVLGNTANTRAALNFPGSVEVYNEIPAEFIPILNSDGSLSIQGNRVVVGIGGEHANYIVQLSYDFGAAALGFMDGAGTWRYAQPKGDYSTNVQLTAEIQRATTVESNLQSAKYDKTGGAISGTVTINGGGGLYVTVDPGGQTSGGYTNYGSVVSQAGGRGGSFGYYVQEQVGVTFNGVIFLSQSNGFTRFLSVPGDASARIKDSACGELAYTSDLANYQPKGNYAAASAISGGTAGNGYYTKTNGILDLVFTITFNTSGGQWVSFPMGFSATPNVFACSDGQHDGQTDTDWFIWGRTKDGFNFNARNFQGSFQIFAKGPA
ncbi:hypothetical protein [Acetobacter persici]|uniref:hypothetical protein n=1 Tax=Acetobacter persici TaxID=1076596 RepID=UPI0039E859B4